MVQRARSDADDRAPGRRHRIGRVLEAQDFGATVLVEPDGLHVTLTSATSPGSSAFSAPPIFSRSPTTTESRREGSMWRAAAAVTSSSPSFRIVGTKVVK